MTEAILRYDRPASRWLESLPLGNGALGAMLDGGFPVTRIELNDETAWSGSPASEARDGLLPAAEAARRLAAARAAVERGDPAAAASELAAFQVPYSQAFLPLGTLVLERTEGEGASYRRELDLAAGIHIVRSGSVVESSFVSAPHGVLVHRIEGAELVGVSAATPHRVLHEHVGVDGGELLLRLPSDVAPTHEPGAVPVSWSDEPGAALEGAIVVGVRRDQDAVLVVVATETTFAGLGAPPAGSASEAATRARIRVDAALNAGWEELRAAHEADYAPRFSRTQLDLGREPTNENGAPLTTDARLARAEADPDGPLAADPALVQLLFDYGRYLLLASSRPGGLPPTLQGIWNDLMQPPWSSNYTLNINAEMNMWAAHPTGLDECAEPLWDFISALAQAGAATAERLYAAGGWVAHHNSDAWLLTAPVGGGHGDARWTAWPFAGPWLVAHIGDAASFGAIHPERLRRLWPAVRGTAEFLLDWVRRGGDGSWTTSPATSPENAYLTDAGTPVAIDATTTMDLSLASAAFATTVQIAGLLGVSSDPVVEASRERLEELPAEPVVGADGAVIEWARERTAEDEHHRHVSHLVGLYPGTRPWSDEVRRAAEVSLTRRGDDSSGWSLVWKSLLWARLGRGDRVEALLGLLFRDADALTGPFAGGLYPNLFAAHPPFQIDANLGFPALVAEAILQSHDGIHLLPALPPGLASGRARGLRARPGVVVDLRWRDGRLLSAQLCLRDGMTERQVRIACAGTTVWRVLRPGEVVALTGADFARGAGEGEL